MMTNNTITAKLYRLLSLDLPSNYDTFESACESISDEFDDLTIEQHADVCEAIEEWWNKGD